MTMRWRDLLAPLRNSLQGQLVVFFLALDLSTLAIASLAVLTDATGAIEEQIRERLGADAAHISQAITEDLRTKREQLRLLADNTLIINGVIDTLGRDSYLDPFIEDLKLAGRAPDSGYFALMDYKGRLITESRPSNRLEADDGWKATVLDGTAHNSAFIDERLGPTLRVAFPVRYLGSVEGILVAEFPLTFIDEITASATGIDVSLVDDAGQVMYGSVPHIIAERARTHAHGSSFYDFEGQLYDSVDLVGLNDHLGLHWHLVLSMDAEAVAAPIRELLWRMVAVGVISATAVIILVFIRARRFVQPVARLQATMQSIVESGDMSRTVRVDTDDEVGVLGRAFNRMMERLATQDARLREEVAERTRAEQRLREANEALSIALRELKGTQAQLIQSEKLASIGQLAAGVAHEINNPLGYVKSNLHSLRTYCTELLSLHDRCAALLTELPELKSQIGMLRAQTDFDFLRNDIDAVIDESEQGLERISRIVTDLKDFSHADQPEMAFVDFNGMLDRVINVAANELNDKADVVREYGELPPVACYAGRIGQVFLNLLVNAAQAIGGRGEIRVRTEVRGGEIAVTVADTGCGIATENLGRVFDPFFTTKPVGKGTGLGLHIAYKLVHDHGGRIEVTSEVGRGTTFVVFLPVNGLRQAEDTSALESEPA